MYETLCPKKRKKKPKIQIPFYFSGRRKKTKQQLCQHALLVAGWCLEIVHGPQMFIKPLKIM